MDLVGILFPATPSATGICWTEIKFGATRKVTLAVRDVYVSKAFYFDLPIDQKLAVLRKLFYLVFLLTYSPKKNSRHVHLKALAEFRSCHKIFQVFFPGHYLP